MTAAAADSKGPHISRTGKVSSYLDVTGDIAGSRRILFAPSLRQAGDRLAASQARGGFTAFMNRTRDAWAPQRRGTRRKSSRFPHQIERQQPLEGLVVR